MPSRSLRFACLGVLLAAVPAGAFDVNSVKDQVDAVIDGVCASAEGFCTLRAAVQEANAAAGPDVINVPAGKYVLKLTGIFENASATGDLDLTYDVTINGAGVGTTIVVGKKDRVFEIHGDSVVDINDLTIAKGAVLSKLDDPPEDLAGGGIKVSDEGRVDMTDVAVRGNKCADGGGGIMNRGNLDLVRVSVEKNKAGGDGGGIDNIDGGVADIRSSTIAKNSAGSDGGGAANNGTMLLMNCTVSGNKAKDEAGGIVNEGSGAALTLTSVTVKGNKTSAKTESGGIANHAGNTITVRNTIFDANKPFNCRRALDLDGGNLETGATCGLPLGESNVKKLGLKGLKDNGGGTKTHALKPESPAIDFGIDGLCPQVDQRGVPRVDVPGVGARVCDSGAFEFVPTP